MTDTLAVRRGEFCPQPGPQLDFLSSPADITIMGGAAYVGKTWAEVYFPLRYVPEPGYTAAIYRQLGVDITHPGGLWDEANKIYGILGGEPNRKEMTWRFPSSAIIKFGHATDEERVKGAQISSLLFDELTHFDESFFWTLHTRNRSTVRGVPAQTCASTNPDADSWVADFLAWWIDQDSASPTYGLPLPQRAGRIRYLARIESKCHWFDRQPDETQLRRLHPRAKPNWCKSVRFIPGKLEDNAIGLRTNPGYEGNLVMADPVTTARLLGGNWKIRRSKGTLFRRAWFEDALHPPTTFRKLCRGWDLAATAGAGDWTVGVLLGLDEHGVWWVLDVVRERFDPGAVEQLVRKTAERDTQEVTQAFAWERAGAGKSQAHHYAGVLAGWNVVGETESGDPTVRASAWSAQVSQHRVRLLAREWAREYVAELEAFPEGRHDDQLAATLAAFRWMTGGLGGELLTYEDVAREYEEAEEDMADVNAGFDFSRLRSLSSL